MFGLALLAAIVWLAGPRALLAALRSTDLGLVAGAGLLYAVAIGLRTMRWRRIVELQGVLLPVAEATRAYGFSMLLAAVTPGRLGQHAKATVVARRSMTLPRAILGTLIDQMLDVVAMGALIPFAVVHLGISMMRTSAWGAAVALGLAATALVSAFVVRRRLEPQLREAVALGRGLLGWPLVATVVAMMAYLFALVLIGRALAMPVAGWTLALAAVASALVELLPITVAGIGTRELSMLALLAPFGVAASEVVALTLIVRSLHVLVGALAYAGGSLSESRRPSRSDAMSTIAR